MNEDADQGTNEILRTLLEDEDDLDLKELSGRPPVPPNMLNRAIERKSKYLGLACVNVSEQTNLHGETYVYGVFGHSKRNNIVATLLYYGDNGWQNADGVYENEDDDYKEVVGPLLKYLPLGTVIHGTSLAEDIIPALIETLATISQEEAEAWQNTWKSRDEDEDYLAYEALPNALQKHCPPYTYFGSHEGNSSDIGVWVNREQIYEAMEDPGTLQAVYQGQPVPRGSKHVVIMNEQDYPVALLDGTTGVEIWHDNS